MTFNRLLTAAGQFREMTFPVLPRLALAALRRLPRDRGGNVAIIFAMTSIPMVMMAGIVVDYGINADARQQAQNAVDATTLSLAKLPPSTTDEDYVNKGKAQLTAAMAKSSAAYTPDVAVDRTNGTVTVKLTGTTPTTLTRLGGFQSLPLNVTGTTKRGSGNLEIALVLDNTGSMAGAKLNNLKNAATTMVNNLFQQVDPAKPNSLKISIVPFTQTVNVGSSNINASWIDKDGLASYHSQLFSKSAKRLQLFTKLNASWGGCVESRPAPYDVSDTSATSSTPDTLFVPYFAPDESDNDNYAANDYIPDYITSSNSDSSNNRTRQSQIDKYVTNAAWKYKSTDRLTTGNLNYSFGPNAGCEMQPITPLTNNQSTLTNSISNMNVSGETNIAIGAVWGWHTLSPTGPLVRGAAYSDQTTRKFIVIMTDGDNTNLKVSNSNGSLYGGISYVWADRLGNFNENTSEATREAAMDSRLTQLCTNIKATGIQIFTIRVEVTSGTSSLLQSCASAANMFYDVQDSSNLTAAFQSIGAQISELRISK